MNNHQKVTLNKIFFRIQGPILTTTGPLFLFCWGFDEFAMNSHLNVSLKGTKPNTGLKYLKKAGIRNQYNQNHT